MPDQLEYLSRRVENLKLRNRRIEIEAELHGALKIIGLSMGIPMRSLINKILMTAVNAYSEKLGCPIMEKMKALKEKESQSVSNKELKKQKQLGSNAF